MLFESNEKNTNLDIEKAKSALGITKAIYFD